MKKEMYNMSYLYTVPKIESKNYANKKMSVPLNSDIVSTMISYKIARDLLNSTRSMLETMTEMLEEEKK